MTETASSAKPLFDGADWSFDTLHRTYEAIEKIALDDLQLNLYPRQIEIISSEQMLDAYSSIGMPLMYHHWSFGKHYLREEQLYRKGAQGLAYEIVINSSPCIAYCLEDNSMALQALVIAHAAFGHNHFFKNNHLFRQWTDPEGIIDYLDYARNYVAGCEERFGAEEVEHILDAAHALMSCGIFRYRRPPSLSLQQESRRSQERQQQQEHSANYLWDSLLHPSRSASRDDREARKRKQKLGLPEENLLYFLERYSPVLKTGQRELLRIVRNLAQYFYPQRQTKMMNEGCACFVHFHILNEMHKKGQLTDGAMLEILHSHTNVITQPDYDDPRFSGINPYALGFAMMQDIRRICTKPTKEDHVWFPAIAGTGDWRNVLKDAWANYRDESFIQQFLSPALIRRFKMFALTDNPDDPWYLVSHIHNESGFEEIREMLSRSYDISASDPDIQIVDVDLMGDRCLKLQYTKRNGIPLDAKTRDMTLLHLQRLWGYEVRLIEKNGE